MITLIVILLIVIISFLACQVRPIHWTNRRQSNKQLVVQIGIYTGGYLLLVFAHRMNTGSYFYTLFLFIGINLVCLGTLIGLCCGIVRMNKLPVITETAKPLLKIIAFTWYGIFGTLCCLNYSFSYLFPGEYLRLEGLSFGEHAFNAVYYTFSVMFTYSGNGIEACGIISRSMEILEVLCSYIFIGIIATNVIGRASEAESNGDRVQ